MAPVSAPTLPPAPSVARPTGSSLHRYREAIAAQIASLEATGAVRCYRMLDWVLDAHRAEDGALTYGPPPEDPQALRRALVIDTETTGTDPLTARIIQVAGVTVCYEAATGRVVRVEAPFSLLHDPGVPIPEAVQTLTGITDDMVAGHVMDTAELSERVAGVDVVIAHNASYDRPVLEREVGPVFADVPWACTLRELPWEAWGQHGTRLGDLVRDRLGVVFDAHRADADVAAVAHLLATDTAPDGRPLMAALLDAARRPSTRFTAVGNSYGAREGIKAMGCKWDGARKEWSLDAAEGTEDAARARLESVWHLWTETVLTARDRHAPHRLPRAQLPVARAGAERGRGPARGR